ncbi:hypothetical protein [Burkholderia ambifaria]|uniref:hypothetical protein n=1 Tax=Burkholderia ambifaria TaxID=152480 RepID=UPI00158BFD9E|nr:hypothetical protein [Burkholderia ambifaria]
MADAAYAELYAESRRGGNAAGRSAGAESGRTISAPFMIFTRLPQSIIFRRITQTITNQIKRD